MHKFKFEVGHLVKVSDIATETASTKYGEKVSTFKDIGTVKEARSMPPGMADDAENFSPHYLISMTDANGKEHDVWFAEPRLSAA